jgi:uncharacterized repeat protein (TIGR04052 family)
MIEHRAHAQTVAFLIVACSGLSSCSAPSEPGPARADAPVDAAPPPGDPEPPAGAEHAAGETRSVSVRFRAVIAGEPFACGARYVDGAGTSFTPADLRFFVADLALLTPDGVEQPVTLDVRPPWQQGSVALVDLEDGSGACAAGTRELNLEVRGLVPAGEYRGLVFTNAVPEALNHADPASLPPPLQAGSMSWGWLQGYRFLVAELAALPSGDAGAGGSALLHLGSSACSGNPSAGGIRCDRPNRNRVRLSDFDPDSDAVTLDVGLLFHGTDLGRVNTCHSSGPDCAPLMERVGLDLTDGSATAQQSVYHAAPLAPGGT